MDDVWKLLAAAGLLFTVWALGRAAMRSFEPHDLAPKNQLFSLLISYAMYAAFATLFGLQLRGALGPFAIVVGATGGYVTSYLSGYEDDNGYAVAKGSAWYLAPVGLSAALAMYGALDGNDASLAIGFLAMAASLGVGAGQLLFSWQATRRVRAAFALTPAAAGSFAAEPVGATAATRCLNGHPRTSDALRFCTTCGAEFVTPAPPLFSTREAPAARPLPKASVALATVEAVVRCANGHPRTPDALRFCTTCGAEFAVAGPSRAQIPLAAVAPAAVGPPLCPNGHELTADALRFCTVCGITVRCRNGHLIPSANAAFCPECGEGVQR